MKRMVSTAMAAGVLFALSLPAFAGDDTCDKGCPKAHAAHATGTPIAATPRTDAPSLGARDARVTVEVWSDFQCPYCQKGADIVDGLREKYGDSVRIVFRHHPLPMHANARLAAIAAMAAGEQGKFWEMHDVLFDNQRSLDRASLERYAKSLGLDVVRFQKALDGGTWANYVDADALEAQKRGVAGTPTFFINGKPVTGAQPMEEFTKLVDAELKR